MKKNYSKYNKLLHHKFENYKIRLNASNTHQAFSNGTKSTHST